MSTNHAAADRHALDGAGLAGLSLDGRSSMPRSGGCEVAVVYLRVSSDQQWARDNTAEGYSIPSQRAGCLHEIELRGWEFDREFVSYGETGKTAEREALREMLDYVKANPHIKYVVVYKVNRVFRNTEEHMAMRAMLRAAGARLISATERFGDDPMGRFMETIIAAQAQYESENMGLEIRRGKTTKVKMGGWPSMAPLGYLNKRETIGGQHIASVILDDQRAPLILEAAERYAKGDISLAQLEEIMWERGLKTRADKRITHKRWAEIFRNPFYTGRLRYEGQEYPGNHPAILSLDLFTQLERVLELRDSAGPRDVRHFHYLKGTLRCHECGALLSYSRSKGRSAYYEYFYCVSKRDCSQPYVPIEEAEREVERIYRHVALPRQTAEAFLKGIREVVADLNQRDDGERDRLNSQLARLEERRRKLVDAYLDGDDVIPKDILREKQQQISDDVQKLEGRLAGLDQRFDRAEQEVSKALQLASAASTRYARYGPETRRRLNKAIFNAIYFEEKRAVRVEWTPLLDPLMQTAASKGGGSDKDTLVERTGIEPVTSGLQSRRSPS